MLSRISISSIDADHPARVFRYELMPAFSPLRDARLLLMEMPTFADNRNDAGAWGTAGPVRFFSPSPEIPERFSRINDVDHKPVDHCK
jgi:hypothetical protein